MIRIILTLSSICSAAFLLSGCLSPIKSGPDNSYLINTLPKSTAKKREHNSILLVAPTDTVPAYNTTQMAYTNKPYQLAYFAENRWADTPTQMITPLIVEALQNSNYFRAVITPPYAGHYDYALGTQIITLKQDFTQQPAVMRLTLRAQLNRVATGQLIANKQFNITVPLQQKTPYYGVIAANQATSTMLQELTSFVTTHLPE
jgi:cholesterol transport system auxiliary component